jgi:hypothetical protein
MKTSQEKQTPYLNWKFETETDDPKTNKQWVYLNHALSGKGAQILKELVRAARNAEYQTGPVNTDDLIGCVVEVQVEFGINRDGTQSKYLNVVGVSPLESFDNFPA